MANSKTKTNWISYWRDHFKDFTRNDLKYNLESVSLTEKGEISWGFTNENRIVDSLKENVPKDWHRSERKIRYIFLDLPDDVCEYAHDLNKQELIKAYLEQNTRIYKSEVIIDFDSLLKILSGWTKEQIIRDIMVYICLNADHVPYNARCQAIRDIGEKIYGVKEVTKFKER